MYLKFSELEHGFDSEINIELADVRAILIVNFCNAGVL